MYSVEKILDRRPAQAKRKGKIERRLRQVRVPGQVARVETGWLNLGTWSQSWECSGHAPRVQRLQSLREALAKKASNDSVENMVVNIEPLPQNAIVAFKINANMVEGLNKPAADVREPEMGVAKTRPKSLQKNKDGSKASRSKAPTPKSRAKHCEENKGQKFLEEPQTLPKNYAESEIL